MNELEQKLLGFICDFAREVTEITYCPFRDEPVFYFGKYEVELLNVCDREEETDSYWLWDDTDKTVQERCENDGIVAFLECEGELYEGLYNFEAMGSRMWGEDTEKVYDRLIGLADEYGLRLDWCGGGIAFYQGCSEKVCRKPKETESRLTNKDLFKFIHSLRDMFEAADPVIMNRMYFRFGRYSCSLKELDCDYELARLEITECNVNVQEFMGDKNVVACLECSPIYYDIFYEHYRGTCEVDDELKDAYDELVVMSERIGLYFELSNNMVIFFRSKRNAL